MDQFPTTENNEHDSGNSKSIINILYEEIEENWMILVKKINDIDSEILKIALKNKHLVMHCRNDVDFGQINVG